MTTSATLQMPPAGGDTPRHAARAAAPPAGEHRRGRGWLAGFLLVVLAAFCAVSPGRTTFETKLGVALDPWRFLGDLGQLWQSQAGFGGLSNQYVGYAFPMLPYYALTDLLRIPTWFAERLWMSLVVTAAFWGALRLAERLGVGGPRSRLLAAACYALWPTFTIVVGSTSAAALPGAVLPWVLLPLTATALSPRAAATRSALAIPFMGGVNASSVLASLLPVGLYLLTRTGPRRTALLAWWLPGVVLATLWWTVPLLLLGAFGEDFLPYVEQADTTTATMAATETLRGAGNWTAYLNIGDAWLPAGWTMATAVLAILGSALAAALGLAGLARRDLPERRWLVLTVLTVVAVTMAGYAGSLGAPFAEGVQAWLDGRLRPFRNVYKFQPGLALALVLGLAHVLALLAHRAHARRAGTGRVLVPLAALAVLPGLALPYVNGDVLQPGAFEKLPAHWQRTAEWLEENAPDSRAYVTPATAHGIHTWGSTIDQPLDVLAQSNWAQRDYVPFGTPGNRRAMDAVEQAVRGGAQAPGLAPFLARAGLHHVVVRNDLDPDQIGYVPPQTVRRTLTASGYTKVAGFGPKITGGRIPADTPLQIAALYPAHQAVEIFAPPEGTAEPGRVALTPAAQAARLSGGPEALLPLADDPRLVGRPTVLTGDDRPGGPATAPLSVRGDGLRRADTRFGLVGANTSYTYTPDERNHPGSAQDPGEEPKQILPSGNAGQTTARLRGAASVTASSSGTWLFHLPQAEPVSAFDGDPNTAWTEGSSSEPVGEWIRIGFDGTRELPGTIDVTPLPGDDTRAAPARVRVETERGTRTSPLRPDGTQQEIDVPRGRSGWLKLTITAVEGTSPGLAGAGFAEITVPDVQVTRLLRLPAEESSAGAETISLHRDAAPGGFSLLSPEPGLHRQFRTAGTTGEESTYALRARAVALPGPALDDLLDDVAPGSRDRVRATAGSTSRLTAATSPRSLVDKDLTTGWIAGADPTVSLRWPGKRKVDELVLAGAGGITARPTQVRISSPDGAATVGVDANGWVRFDEIETDALDITVTATEQVTVHNPFAGKEVQLPVGLSEVYVPALDDLRAEAPDPEREFTLPCGSGPELAVDGRLLATKVSGTVGDLTGRRALDVELCAGPEKDGDVRLGTGLHTVEAADGGALGVTDVTLTRGGAGAVEQLPQPEVLSWGGDDRSVEVPAGEAAYLQTFENVNDGWSATLNGRELRPVRLDGWQQGFYVPQGQGGTVTLEYRPAAWYKGALVAGLVGLLVLLASALVRRDRGRAPEPEETGVPDPGWVLGTLALTLVLFLVSGPYALLVPLLALLARFRPGLLPGLAALAMTAAGVVAVFGSRGDWQDGSGAFSHAAQALALLALAAALVTLPGRSRAERDAPPAPETQPEVPAADPPTVPQPRVTAAGPLGTVPAQRQRPAQETPAGPPAPTDPPGRTEPRGKADPLRKTEPRTPEDPR